MCGFCGIYSSSPDESNQSLVERMTQSLKHRGPDEEGFLSTPQVFFGHKRLKVIDLKSGKQPMTSRDGQVSLVFNGEIYNFKEIREQLEKKDRVFASHSDTESLLQLYEEKGIECVKELKGMFSFSIYDRRSDKLYLAVDRFGKKPLYYTQKLNPFLFASELRALLLHPSVSKKISEEALSQYLAFEYVPAPLSMIEGVLKLEAAHYLEVTKQSIKKVCYWEADFSDENRSENEWKEILLREYESSVRKRLISDVPLGVFLSGGLDSSSVLAMVKKIEPGRRMKTFSIAFKEPSFDESRYAKLVSGYFNTEHIEESCSVNQMLEEHEAILEKMDEPLADASFIPTFMLCRLARRHVTVALSGDGGDELFYGYPTFEAHRLANRLRFIPSPLIRGMQVLAKTLPTSMENISFDFKVKQFLKGLSYKGFETDQAWLGAFTGEEQKSLLRKNAFNPFAPLKSLKNAPGADSLKKLQAFYFKFYLQGDILVKTDRASMANSLEVRSPLLDDDLTENMLKVPSSLKLKGCETKYIFKKAMEGLLPREIIYRSKKGFGIPIAQWIRKDLKAEFTSVLSRKNIEKDGLFDALAIESLLKEHLDGKVDNRKKLWSLYVFQKWKKSNVG